MSNTTIGNLKKVFFHKLFFSTTAILFLILINIPTFASSTYNSNSQKILSDVTKETETPYEKEAFSESKAGYIKSSDIEIEAQDVEFAETITNTAEKENSLLGILTPKNLMNNLVEETNTKGNKVPENFDVEKNGSLNKQDIESFNDVTDKKNCYIEAELLKSSEMKEDLLNEQEDNFKRIDSNTDKIAEVDYKTNETSINTDPQSNSESIMSNLLNIFGTLIDETAEAVIKGLEHGEAAGFIVEGGSPAVFSELIRKGVMRGVKGVLIPDNIQAISLPLDTVTYMKRVIVDLHRDDIRKSIKTALKKKDYKKVEAIIAGSVRLLGNQATAIETVGLGTIGVVTAMGAESPGDISKYFLTQVFYGTVLGELSVATAESVIELEKPQDIFIPTLIKVAASGAFAKLYKLMLDEANYGMVAYGIGEIAGSIAGASYTKHRIKNSPEYDNYNFDNLTIPEVDFSSDTPLKEVASKKFLLFSRQTLTEGANMFMDYYTYGKKAFKIRSGWYKLFFDFTNALPAGNAKHSRKLLNDALASEMSEEVIEEIVKSGDSAAIKNAMVTIIPFGINSAKLCWDWWQGNPFSLDDLMVLLGYTTDQVSSFNFNRMMEEQGKALGFSSDNTFEENRNKASTLRAEISVTSALLMRLRSMWLNRDTAESKIRISTSRRVRLSIRLVNYALIFAPILCEKYQSMQPLCNSIDHVYDLQTEVFEEISENLAHEGAHSIVNKYIFKPVVNDLEAVAGIAYEYLLEPTKNDLKIAYNKAYEHLLKPTTNDLRAAVNTAYISLLEPITDDLGANANIAYKYVLEPTINDFKATTNRANRYILEPTVNNLKAAAGIAYEYLLELITSDLKSAANVAKYFPESTTKGLGAGINVIYTYILIPTLKDLGAGINVIYTYILIPTLKDL